MSICASCGRQRDGDARFCRDCGSEFTGSPQAPEDAAAAPPETIEAVRTAPAPRELGDVTRVEQPDPFASWYRTGPPATAASDGDAWPRTQTVGTAPAGFVPSGPSFPPGAPAGPGSPVAPGPPEPPRVPAAGPGNGGRRGLFAVVAVVVVLAAGGGAYSLARSLGHHAAAQPSPPASRSAPASASASPSPSPSLVAVAPAVTSSAAPAVQTLLNRYFAGINSHDYAEYTSALTAADKARQTEKQFDTGYATTTDSGMTLTALTSGSGGGLTATVTFTSRQAAAQSIDKSDCNNWSLDLPLVQQGGSYLIGPAPAGYRPQYSDC